MSDFVEQVVEDLRAFSADLLEVGLATGVTPRASGMGSNASLLNAIDSLTSLVPRLLVELETSEGPTRLQENVTPSPTRATLSRRPSDYHLRDGRVMPRRWVRMVPVGERDPRPLRWLLHLLDRQRAQLAETHDRTNKRVNEALSARRGHSEWAHADAANLRAIMDRIRDSRARLQRAIKSVQRAHGPRPIPSPLAPSPYPQTQSWVALRRLAIRLIDPHQFLPEHVSGLLGTDIATADLPYLYQRWCGVRIIKALNALGWTVPEDPVGAVFLGGLITFKRDAHAIDLWVEPRLARRGRHPSGFKCVHGEDVTPDYLFVTPGPGGPDAFVIDATLVTNPEELVAKGRYLDFIELENLVRIAGCPIKRRPRLAWAAAPIVAAHCKALRSDGAIGTVPMNPLHWDAEPLRAWVGDVARHALAWSLVDAAQ